ncbi:hypothetical protein PybrP1_004543 [[Pythium] brassicae (nom. inval.)]|nr:hypothetical protein PybrP1_004543 [[Pythium] brassicae (nom. inval.)]
MDKYTKLAKIGKGSFGCAYLAVRKSDPLGKKLVIKEIRMDPRDQQSALREAKLLAALDHPNIIACKESFLLPASPPSSALGGGAAAARLPPPPQVLCIVTEYADGGDLRKRLERGPRMREGEILDLHTLACAETLAGTPYYTSPEICLGRRYNHKTDVWSLGCVLFELAALAHAFDGRSQRQLFDNIVSASAPPMPAGAAVSARFADLVAEMLRKNPRERPSVNQIIKRPIVMERIQGFLSQRAVADELNHTVLHGHDIFRDKSSARVPAKLAGVGSKSPSPAANNVVRRADAAFGNRGKKHAPATTPRRKKLSGGGVGKPPSVLLKKSRSFKKAAVAAAAPPTPTRGVRDRKPVVRASAVGAAASNPSQATLEQRNRLLLQKKRAVVEKAKQEGLQARLAPPPVPPASSKNAQVADRISAFNAQAKKLNALEKKVCEYPKPVVTATPAPVSAALPPPPPPAPAPALRKKVTTGAAVVKAAAAKQRDAMRRDILSRKQELKRAGARASAHGSRGGSPLDDPIILVQNLPDYAALEPPPSLAATTLDAPKARAPANLEFARMVLQLKSVVECCSDLDDEPSDGDDEVEESADKDRPACLQAPRERAEADACEAPCAPLPPAYDRDVPPKLSVLKLSILEDPRFTTALRALLAADASGTTAPAEDSVFAAKVSLEHRQTLQFMRAYIASLTQ